MFGFFFDFKSFLNNLFTPAPVIPSYSIDHLGLSDLTDFNLSLGADYSIPNTNVGGFDDYDFNVPDAITLGDTYGQDLIKDPISGMHLGNDYTVPDALSDEALQNAINSINSPINPTTPTSNPTGQPSSPGAPVDLTNVPTYNSVPIDLSTYGLNDLGLTLFQPQGATGDYDFSGITFPSAETFATYAALQNGQSVDTATFYSNAHELNKFAADIEAITGGGVALNDTMLGNTYIPWFDGMKDIATPGFANTTLGPASNYTLVQNAAGDYVLQPIPQSTSAFDAFWGLQPVNPPSSTLTTDSVDFDTGPVNTTQLGAFLDPSDSTNIGGLLGDIVHYAENIFDPVAQSVVNLGQSAVDFVQDPIGSLTNTGTGFLNNVTGTLSKGAAAIEGIPEFVSNLPGTISSGVSSFVQDPIGSVGDILMANVNAIPEAISGAATAVTFGADPVYGALTGYGSSLVGSLTGAEAVDAQKYGSGISGFLEETTQGIGQSLATGLEGGVDDALITYGLGHIGGYDSNLINQATYKAFQAGATQAALANLASSSAFGGVDTSDYGPTGQFLAHGLVYGFGAGMASQALGGTSELATAAGIQSGVTGGVSAVTSKPAAGSSYSADNSRLSYGMDISTLLPALPLTRSGSISNVQTGMTNVATNSGSPSGSTSSNNTPSSQTIATSPSKSSDFLSEILGKWAGTSKREVNPSYVNVTGAPTTLKSLGNIRNSIFAGTFANGLS